MATQHLYKFSKVQPQEKSAAGSRTRASKDNFPLLKGMSFYKLLLHPKGVREPHWHANADELGYCLKGEALVSLYATGNVKSTFFVKSGDVFFIPSGSLHYLENVGENTAEFIICFNNEEVEDFGLSSTFGEFTNAVLGNTWGVRADVFEKLKRTTQPTFAGLRQQATVVPDESHYPTPYRFDLAGSRPLVNVEGGTARMARQDGWPIVKKQALYSLILTGKGMREPHWHPETAELGYVEKGKGRMSIMNPQGDVDTYIMEEGDIYFIPKAYPHHIENLSDDDTLHLLIFFDQAMPRDIGFTGSVRSFPSEALAASLNLNPQFFDNLIKYYEDLFIVNKENPLD